MVMVFSSLCRFAECPGKVLSIGPCPVPDKLTIPFIQHS